jgi:hypothetical protein
MKNKTLVGLALLAGVGAGAFYYIRSNQFHVALEMQTGAKVEYRLNKAQALAYVQMIDSLPAEQKAKFKSITVTGKEGQIVVTGEAMTSRAAPELLSELEVFGNG